jgi:hypothetical protein
MFTDFIATKPSERSGPRSANRFDYQLSWAFCLLLDLESGNKDYLVVLDYHDDVVVFDSESSPSSAEFYQIKTDTRNKWTLPRLIERMNGSGHSILGKLYAHRINFGDKARQLSFVSNQCFRLKTTGAKDSVDIDGCRLSELCAEALKNVASKLQAEHGLSVAPAIGIEIALRRDEWLPATGHQTQAEGKLSRFLAEKFGERPYSTSHAFRALMDVLRRRNNSEDAIQSPTDLSRKKGIGHIEFSTLLARIAANSDSNKWARVESLLVRDGLQLVKLTRLKLAWGAREAQLLDLANSNVQDSQEQADSTLKELEATIPDATLVEWLSKGLEICRAKLQPLGVPYSDDQITGMLLSAITKIQP